MIQKILNTENYTKQNLVKLLQSEGNDRKLLFSKSSAVKEEHIANIVYLRALIEFSNHCEKDCLYCGIRKSNSSPKRYTIPQEEVNKTIDSAINKGYSSIVIQAGECKDEEFIETINNALIYAKEQSGNKLGITLSLGEQEKSTYQKWFDLGAHRYLLRIESSSKELFETIHPRNENHSFETRLQKLKELKEIGFQVGTGVMIGLPNQTLEDLADDLLFMKAFDIDMCGMGPYIVSPDTPLAKLAHKIPSEESRIDLSLKMIALLRLLMNDINIASTTALQTLTERAREEGIKVGANIIMPNLTAVDFKESYKLYNKKTDLKSHDDTLAAINLQMERVGHKVEIGKWGDSLHFEKKCCHKLI
ncbi:MAG: [FeFe] hydrogenase H-cluster radical SAM maturase HydE [Bacteroidota bacterium]